MDLELIPAKTRNGTMKMYSNHQLYLTVGGWPRRISCDDIDVLKHHTQMYKCTNKCLEKCYTISFG